LKFSHSEDQLTLKSNLDYKIKLHCKFDQVANLLAHLPHIQVQTYPIP